MIHAQPFVSKRIIMIVLGLTVVVASIAMVFELGGGPVGPESVLSKEVEDLIAQAAAQADATVSPMTFGNPEMLTLPGRLEWQRRTKRLLAAIGVVYPAGERIKEFTLTKKLSSETVRCMVLLRGDHVIGLAVVSNRDDDPFAGRIRSALSLLFNEYQVQQLRSPQASLTDWRNGRSST